MHLVTDSVEDAVSDWTSVLLDYAVKCSGKVFRAFLKGAKGMKSPGKAADIVIGIRFV